MAKLVTPDNEEIIVKPKNGKTFALEELQKFVGGFIELVPYRLGGKLMFVNEDGIALNLKMNKIATNLCYEGNRIVGNAIVCDEKEVQ